VVFGYFGKVKLEVLLGTKTIRGWFSLTPFHHLFSFHSIHFVSFSHIKPFPALFFHLRIYLKRMYGSIGLVHCLVTRCLIGSLPGMELSHWLFTGYGVT
jgi:hypothetical protein